MPSATRRTCGIGLLAAGVIVTAIGLVIVAMHTLEIPRQWTTVAVGVGLLVLGAIRWAIRAGGDEGAVPR